MNIAIIGCGLIGRKRALALDSEDKLVACCDTNLTVANKFSADFNCIPFTDYNKLLKEVECDAVVVSVINKFAKDIIIDALKGGKNVLAEKPLGRNVSESNEILKVFHNEIKNGHFAILKTGFNHRFHPAVWQAKQMVGEGKIGKIFNIRARYGHGGRPGMENEWRASKDLCGGGELLDQGVHIIDLIQWFGGEVKEVFGKVETKFWNMEVEDNAFAILKTINDITASFHVSWTNWKNIFSFEIFGTDGYLKIEGLGGSYGAETLEYGIRKKEGGRPDIEIFEYSPVDVSWQQEWMEFKNAIKDKREPIGSGLDGLKANEVIAAIYSSSDEKRSISVK
jgi:predicted dehydrogenase